MDTLTLDGVVEVVELTREEMEAIDGGVAIPRFLRFIAQS